MIGNNLRLCRTLGRKLFRSLMLLLALPLAAQAAWRAAGDVSRVVRKDEGAELTLSSGAHASVILISPTVARVRSPRRFHATTTV
jgi:hypothetical protein